MIVAPVKNYNFLKHPYGDTTQYFGENPELYQKYTTYSIAHNGVDIVRPHGEHLFACEDGIISSIKTDPNGYGKAIHLMGKPNDEGILHDWVYGHLDRIFVQAGQEVKAGQFIGTMGNTGFVVSGNTPFWGDGANQYKGTHLHWGLRDVVHDGGGWRYEGYPRGLRVLNSKNGYQGRYDPLPLFAPKQALRVAYFANKLSDKGDKEAPVFWQGANILRVINV